MTVIAWDGNILAADKQATNVGLIRTTTKIKRFGNILAGASGDCSACCEGMAWIERGRNLEDYPKIQLDKDDYAALLVIEHNRVLTYEKSPYPMEFEDKIFAIGSGRDFALAAMYCGKTAKEAVEIASIFENGCGNGVDVLIP